VFDRRTVNDLEGVLTSLRCLKKGVFL
jgi:hypothetical protein